MKKKSKELDVDFIGGQSSMTKEEERKISDFLKSKKLLRQEIETNQTRSGEAKKSGGNTTDYIRATSKYFGLCRLYRLSS